jgi:zinc transport system permease protein
MLALVPFDWCTEKLDGALRAFSAMFDPFSFFGQESNVRAVLAVVMMCLICSSVGSLVLSNRMAFFSDALAHCAFAGVTLGFILYFLVHPANQTGDDFWVWTLPIMCVFGALFGLGIAWVRERTGQANDTVIGVFFAGAIGFAAVLRNLIATRRYFNLEEFLFGSPLSVSAGELFLLFIVMVITVVFLAFFYNDLVFTSFNESLARSRRVKIRLCNYLLIVLLAVLVNVCLRTVGALLINAMLIVPAAAARNAAANLRQLIRYSLVISLIAGIAGIWLSADVKIPDEASGRYIQFGMSGSIIMISVAVFFLLMAVGPWLRDRKRMPRTAKS